MEFWNDLKASLRYPQYWTYSTWLRFALKYRKTSLGPLWLLVGPSLFVVFLGYMFSQVNSSELNVFVPHLAIGYITWTLMSGYINGGCTVFLRKRSEILQGNMRLTDVVLADNFEIFLHYLHQIIIILCVFLYFKIAPSAYSFHSIIGLILLIYTGFWVTVLLGLIGARYRDLVEIVTSVMRICFFITPIIWIPLEGTGGALGSFLIFNPFYHYLELIRGPLLDNPVSQLSWIVVIGINMLGTFVTVFTYSKSARFLALWV